MSLDRKLAVAEGRSHFHVVVAMLMVFCVSVQVAMHTGHDMETTEGMYVINNRRTECRYQSIQIGYLRYMFQPASSVVFP